MLLYDAGAPTCCPHSCCYMSCCDRMLYYYMFVASFVVASAASDCCDVFFLLHGSVEPSHYSLVMRLPHALLLRAAVATRCCCCILLFPHGAIATCLWSCMLLCMPRIVAMYMVSLAQHVQLVTSCCCHMLFLLHANCILCHRSFTPKAPQTRSLVLPCACVGMTKSKHGSDAHTAKHAKHAPKPRSIASYNLHL